jgi:hypothetical protein
MTLKHLKSRHGECRTLSLRFDRARQSFTPEPGSATTTAAATSKADRGKLRSALAELWNRTPAASDEGGDDE